MRVALVSGYDWAIPGGAQGQVAALAHELIRLGETVAVVTPQWTKGQGPALRGGRVYRAGKGRSFHVNGSVAPIAPGPGSWISTWQALSAFSPDVVHVHEPFIPGPPLAALLGPKHPLVATFHRAGTDVVYRTEARFLGGAFARRCRVATGVSRAAIETASDTLGRHHVSFIEVANGLELERFEKARMEFEAGRPAGGPYKQGSRPTVAFLGRLERRKGVVVLLKAVSNLDREPRLLIAGAGPEADSLQRRAGSDRGIVFHGRVDDETAASLIASADVFVAPALGGESFGMVVLEAMAAGTAVVASEIDGYARAAGGAALLFPPGDSEELSRVLAKLLEDHDGRRELVRLGLERAASCSIENVALKYMDLYRVATAKP